VSRQTRVSRLTLPRWIETQEKKLQWFDPGVARHLHCRLCRRWFGKNNRPV